MHWPTYIANAEVSEPVASGEGLSEERDEEVSEERSDGVRPPKGRPEQADRPRARIAAEAPRARAGRIAWDIVLLDEMGSRPAGGETAQLRRRGPRVVPVAMLLSL